MTSILHNANTFHEDMLAGFVDANARYARAVTGGVVRAQVASKTKVSVVIGGGSGHYPSFAGLVGVGVADGAAVGGVFASPSAERIVRVAEAAHRGAGVLLTFGNYTGDVLNFSIARQRLCAAGIDTRIVAVTDDIASAPPLAAAKRRGIAGDLVVFKAAGAAAEAGYDLDGVERVATEANARTRSFGVAFAGCTLPGSAAPLFTVPEGSMSLGMGIHGEPGISEAPVQTADALGRLLVERVLAEQPPAAGNRAAVILNGLGATKYEELFVLWRTIADVLRNRGIEVVDPEVGELTTSLDMAGCSLTICWLTDELERLWCAPAETAAYRKHALSHPGVPASPADPPAATANASLPVATGRATKAGADDLVALLAAVVRTLRENENHLGALDAIAGDGDHGAGMVRGAAAALAAARQAAADGVGSQTVLQTAADAWADESGGTSGALWGVGLRAWAGHLSDHAAPTQAEITRGAQAALGAIQLAGGAQPGDKTLVDALVPFVDTLVAAGEAGETLATAWQRAAAACAAAAEATADLVPRLGRARPLAARSVGHPDPGATSLGLCVTAIAALLPCGRTDGD